MKHLLIVVIVLSGIADAQDRVQLKDLRARFINQKIIINGSFSDNPVSFLAGWQFVKEKKGHYEANYSKEVPTSLTGRSGVIIAVQAPPALGASARPIR